MIVAADAVSTPYNFEECYATAQGLFNNNVCVATRSVQVDSAAVIPPFTYNNQCASVLLTSYLPVLILGFSIQLVLCFLLPVLLFQAGNFIHLEDIIHHRIVGGILWPEYWLKSDESDLFLVNRNKACVKDPRTVFNPTSTLCFVILNDLMVMLSFGLCSPILAAAVTCSLVLQMCSRILLVGRFTSILTKNDAHLKDTGHRKKSNDVHFALVALGKVQFPVREVFQRSFWMIGWCSGLFCALVCWDIAADDVGWSNASWIPITTLCYPIILWGMLKVWKNYQKGPLQGHTGANRTRETELVSASFVTTTAINTENPIHLLKHDPV